jgi:hypothetical protein
MVKLLALRVLLLWVLLLLLLLLLWLCVVGLLNRLDGHQHCQALKGQLPVRLLIQQP